MPASSSDQPRPKPKNATHVDDSKRNCPKLEDDTLVDQQPVQLPPQLSGTGTTWCLNDHTGERVLHTLKVVEVELGSAVEQAVTVVKMRTDDTHYTGLMPLLTSINISLLSLHRLPGTIYLLPSMILAPWALSKLL